MACQKKNSEYRDSMVEQARKMRDEFCRQYGDTLRKERTPIASKEMRGRKARNAIVASHQLEDRDDC
jgi:hypothetical protein